MKTIKSLFISLITFLAAFFLNEKQIFNLADTVGRQKEFVRQVEQVHVKKGSRRYTLLIIQTLTGTVRINLGRYKTDQEIQTIIDGYGGQYQYQS